MFTFVMLFYRKRQSSGPKTKEIGETKINITKPTISKTDIVSVRVG